MRTEKKIERHMNKPHVELYAAYPSSMFSDSDMSCWICLDECTTRSCKCPSVVHPKCLAEWQTNKIGTREEKHCRFCDDELQDWRFVVYPEYANIMKKYVTFSVQGRSVPVNAELSNESFEQIANCILEHPIDSKTIAFKCIIPGQTKCKVLHGIESFHAAVFCKQVQKAILHGNDVESVWPDDELEQPQQQQRRSRPRQEPIPRGQLLSRTVSRLSRSFMRVLERSTTI